MKTRDRFSSKFITPEQYKVIGDKALQGPNGWLLFVACNAGVDFADAVKDEYEGMLRENGNSTDHLKPPGGDQSDATFNRLPHHRIHRVDPLLCCLTGSHPLDRCPELGGRLGDDYGTKGSGAATRAFARRCRPRM